MAGQRYRARLIPGEVLLPASRCRCGTDHVSSGSPGDATLSDAIDRPATVGQYTHN